MIQDEKMAEEKVAKASGAKKAKAGKKSGRGMQVARYFTTPGVRPGRRDRLGAAAPRPSPARTARSSSSRRTSRSPRAGRRLATNVVASKYFRGSRARPSARPACAS